MKMLIYYGLFLTILSLNCILGDKDLQHKRIKRQTKLRSDAKDPCTTPENEPGTCTSIQDCPTLWNLLQTRGLEPNVTQFLRKSRCGDDMKNRPKVCCATNDYSACGKTNSKTTRITAGRNSSLGNWPWIAAIGYQRGVSIYKDFKCAGSLISDRWVVTAGHCANELEYSLRLTTVRLGELNLDENVDDGANPIDIPVVEIITHPNFTYSPLTNDVTLLRLQEPVTFTSRIRPICLPDHENFRNAAFYRNMEPFIAGWGAIVERGSPSRMLQEAQIGTISNEICRENYSPIRTANINDNVICAGRNGTDSCQGDSGGPMMIPFSRNNTFYLVGVVSFGYGCGHERYPGVYTRVASFTSWINQIVGV